MKKNESVDNRVSENQELFENLTTKAVSPEEVQEARKNYYAPTEY